RVTRGSPEARLPVQVAPVDGARRHSLADGLTHPPPRINPRITSPIGFEFMAVVGLCAYSADHRYSFEVRRIVSSGVRRIFSSALTAADVPAGLAPTITSSYA
ncbi:hypothetical protein, partial [Streptomyces sp. NPDC059928]|uniref:hypothetical protein n=1 Tax=Streptomyces sp. NPDC059928 TaxID=3347007 RepID=UPI003650607B